MTGSVHTVLTKIAVYTLILLAFSATSLVQLNLVPYEFTWLTEVLIFVLLVIALYDRSHNRRQVNLFGSGIILIYFFVSLLSAIHNGVSHISFALFLRQTLRFHLMLLILINLDLPEEFILKVHILIFWLFVIQIPTVVIKLFIYGQGERAIGTYSMTGGGNSAVIPLIAVSFLLCYHFLHKNSFSYLLLILGFVAFAIIGGKRAIVILGPLTIIFTAVIIIKTLNSRKVPAKNVTIAGLAFFGAPILVYLGIRLLPDLNPDQKVWGRFSTSYATDYVLAYTTYEKDAGMAVGRTAATINTYQYLRQKGTAACLLGLGPGHVMMSSVAAYDNPFLDQKEQIGVMYGMTALNYLALQIGYVGTALWIGFYVYAMQRLWWIVKAQKNSYWLAYSVSMVCVSFVAVLISLTYNDCFVVDDLTAFIYMLLLSFAVRHQQIRYNVAKAATDRFKYGRCFTS